MCGLAGIVGLHGDAASGALGAMLSAIVHRGPDDAGTWHDDAAAITIGHRRLSIIDTSPAGHQPMLSARGRFVLAYNGEIYNYAELRASLEQEGAAPPWRGHSDTEVLLAGFEHWGMEGTLKHSNGMFALAAWDRSTSALTLARDRMGEKPLYFGWVGGAFAFASELKAFARLPGWSARMNPAAIASFLGTGYVRGPQSAIVGVYRLPPGTSITLSLEDLQQPRDWAWLSEHLKPYWSLREAAVSGLASPFRGIDIDAADETLETLLQDAVRLRMVSDVPLGAFLSGGIDSSLVVALMQAQSMQPVRTFSIGFHESGHDEAPHARAVARHLGTDHTELYVAASDTLELMPRLAETFDEPFADSSQLPTMIVSALARQHVTVALSGDGGDELFAGYGRYFSILGLWHWLSRTPMPLRRLIAPALGGVASATQWLSHMRDASFRLGRLAERLEACDVDALRLSFIGAAGASRMQTGQPMRDLAHCLPPHEVQDALRRLMYADQLDYLPDDILHKVDRASMAYSLEARVPLLDHRVVEWSWRLPTMALTQNSEGKQPLRRILVRHVPRTIIDRPKQGFSPPVSTWLRGPLRDWAETLLAESALAELPMLDAGAVRRLWAKHLSGHMDASGALWNVLMLADWRQRFKATC